MSRCTRLHSHLCAWRQSIAQRLDPFIPLQLRPPLRTIMPIYGVNVEDGLGDIESQLA